LEQSPQSGVHAHDERDYGGDGTHERITTRGRIQRPEPVPKVRPRTVCLNDTLARGVEKVASRDGEFKTNNNSMRK
jgi:hypothetical protein